MRSKISYKSDAICKAEPFFSILLLGATEGRIGMPELSHLGIGTIVFFVGAIIYIVNLVINLSRRGRPLPLDGVGTMVLGIGLALVMKW